MAGVGEREPAPPRVLFVTGEYPPMVGGIGDYTAHLAAALAAQGVRVDVLTSVRAAGHRQGAVLPGVDVHPIVRGWRVAGLPWLIGQIRRLRPDLVHIQYQPAAFDLHGAVHLLPAAITGLLRVPVVVTFHDLRIPYLFPKAGPLRDFANATLARTADAVVTTNDEDRREVLDWGLPSPQVYAIPLGQNLPRAAGEHPVTPARSNGEQGPPSARSTPAPRIGFFGLVNRSKGLETLLAAIDRLRQAGRDVELDIIGGGAGASDATNDAYLAEVRGLVRSLGLEAVVRFVRPPDEVALTDALRRCAVLALPFDDGASLRRTTLITALAHGVPTVTTTGQSALALSASGVGPETRFALDESVAIFVPPRDAAALADAIAGLLDDTARGRRLAEHGVAATQRLQWDAIAAGHRAIYARVLARRPRGVVWT